MGEDDIILPSPWAAYPACGSGPGRCCQHPPGPLLYEALSLPFRPVFSISPLTG